ncbi:hypothetical protein Y032_0035g2978 [Ancylostoma ceylanicum]|uniref:Uncharacterized protein n=1 Tax=Ancylostoma ceylanicum TaxID=53326 RepID=A0A016UKA5_9BILA|nr:hypothetical protein Y032_0035g2978 [Ancylostoma ceylanicum]
MTHHSACLCLSYAADQYLTGRVFRSMPYLAFIVALLACTVMSGHGQMTGGLTKQDPNDPEHMVSLNLNILELHYFQR